MVLKIPHSLENMALDMSMRLLNPTPPSSLGRHIFSYANLCLFLPYTLVLHNIPQKIFSSSYIMNLGGNTTNNKYKGMLCSTLAIKKLLPPNKAIYLSSFEAYFSPS